VGEMAVHTCDTLSWQMFDVQLLYNDKLETGNAILQTLNICRREREHRIANIAIHRNVCDVIFQCFAIFNDIFTDFNDL
jgi:hypothetical protein